MYVVYYMPAGRAKDPWVFHFIYLPRPYGVRGRVGGWHKRNAKRRVGNCGAECVRAALSCVRAQPGRGLPARRPYAPHSPPRERANRGWVQPRVVCRRALQLTPLPLHTHPTQPWCCGPVACGRTLARRASSAADGGGDRCACARRSQHPLVGFGTYKIGFVPASSNTAGDAQRAPEQQQRARTHARTQARTQARMHARTLSHPQPWPRRG